MANGHDGEDYYKTARAEKKGRLRDFAIHVTPSCRVLLHAPLGFINVRHNSAIYIYICVCVYFFFLFSCYKSPWRNIFASPLLLAFQQIVIVNRLIVALIGVNTCVHTRDSLSFFFLHLCSFSFFLLFFYKKAFKLKEHLDYVFAKAYSANFSTILS